METIAKIRRDHFVHGKSIKQIARERGVSRNTVRKVIRSDATDFTYTRTDQPMPKLGAFRDRLDQLLEQNASNSRRERLTLIRIYEFLQAEGYTGGYDAPCVRIVVAPPERGN